MGCRLLLLRHAKSDWDAAYDHDHDRPLARRGVRDARLIGRFLTAAGQAPDLAIHSTAIRATRTAELAAEAGGWSCPVHATGELYEADFMALLSVVHHADPAATRLLLVGHQPLWSIAAARLIGGGAIRLPTAAVACIRFEVSDWRSVTEGSGELAWLITPKLLRGV
ncbi:MAG: SixA phosphatase family protein [Thermoanaerobaculia bacterium]